jgi:hypothetical protein
MKLTGVVLIPDGKINENGRKYPLDILKTFEICDLPLTYEGGIFPKKISTVNLVGIVQVKVDGNKLVGEAEILDSRSEELLKALNVSPLFFGCCGYGNVNDKSEVTDYQMMGLINNPADDRIDPVVLL